MIRACPPEPRPTRSLSIASALRIQAIARAPSHRGAKAIATWCAKAITIACGPAIALGCASAPVETVVVAVPKLAPTTAPSVATEAPPACPAGMALVAGGALVLAGRSSNVADLCMDTTEVTSAAYAQCVDRGACDDDELACDEAPTNRQAALANHPINCVSWAQANRYCRAVDKRLPTFEEWEWAAQARGEHRRFAWGDEPPGPDTICWSKGTPRAGTCTVSAFPASRTPEGIDDLFGGVWEWLAPEMRNGSPNIARGASFQNDTLDMLEGENSGYFLPGFVRNDVTGFRCVAAPASM